jgi:hypothetical protein
MIWVLVILGFSPGSSDLLQRQGWCVHAFLSTTSFILAAQPLFDLDGPLLSCVNDNAVDLFI